MNGGLGGSWIAMYVAFTSIFTYLLNVCLNLCPPEKTGVFPSV